MEENLADIKLRKQLSVEAGKNKPSLPFFSGEQTRNRLAKKWPVIHPDRITGNMTMDVSTPRADDISYTVDQVRMTEATPELTGRRNTVSRRTPRTNLMGDVILGKRYSPTYENKKVYVMKTDLEGES